MNQRIQQLALEAEVFAKQNNGDFHYFYTRKLSELIVQECAGVSENHKGMNDKYFIADAIKQHFGVEE